MSSYRNAPDNLDCESAGGAVFIGNVGLSDYQEPEPDITKPAMAMLAIDVISPPGSQHWRFHFVTLELQIDAPAGALFVDHSQRDNYHREVLADPDAVVRPDPDVAYWTESGEPTATLRVREDETTLLSGPGNGRTYYVGIAGVGADLAALRFSAVAAGSLVRESSCHLVVDELRAGDRIPGYLD
jgi:hypothetical protein